MITCHKELKVRLPMGIYNDVQRHINRYDAGHFDAFILRAVQLTMEHDKAIDTEIDTAMSRHWADEAEAHRWDGIHPSYQPEE